MRISAEIHYTQPPAAVSAMTFDPAFQDRKCAATGALSHSVDVAHAGEHTVITTERVMPTSDFPDFLKTIVGATLTIREVDDWGPADADGARHGTIVVTVGGTPLKFSGTLVLAPTDAGSRAAVEGDLKANVPLIGGKVEKAAEPAVMAAVAAEEKTATLWVAERS